MPAGRPFRSAIRQNLVELLALLGEGYGYELYKYYRRLFPQCSQKAIYYNLRAGLATREFVIKRVERVKGEYSWGGEAEKVVYGLGPKAQPKGDPKLAAAFAKLKGHV